MKHLKSVKESYLKHLAEAFLIFIALIISAIITIIHALLPFLFEHTGSKIIRWILDRNDKRNTKTI